MNASARGSRYLHDTRPTDPNKPSRMKRAVSDGLTIVNDLTDEALKAMNAKK